MNKKVLLLVSAAAVIIVSLYFLLFSSNETKILEISFISDHPMESEDGKFPKVIGELLGIYENNSDGKVYYTKAKFIRCDLNNSSDPINYSKEIDTKMSLPDAESLFENETSNLPLTKGMTVPSNSQSSVNIDRYVKNIRTFRISASGADNREVFYDSGSLRNYISDQIKKNSLFEKGQKPNTLTIIFTSGESEMESEAVEGNDDLGDIKPEPIENQEREVVVTPSSNENYTPIERAKTYDAKLRSNGNDFTWSQDLADNASRLRIEFVCLGDKIVSEDVTNKTSFHFSYSNSNYDSEPTKVSLIATFENGSSVKNNFLNVSNLECH